MSTAINRGNKPFFLILAGVLALATFIVYTERFSAPALNHAGFNGVPWSAAQLERTIELRFTDRPDGAVTVINHKTNQEIHSFTGEASFIRTVMRSLASERIRRGIGSEKAFELSLHKDGRLTLRDPVTDRAIELEAFGKTNAAHFVKLLKS
jgi:putative photosynthetic complex assembly protein